MFNLEEARCSFAGSSDVTSCYNFQILLFTNFFHCTRVCRLASLQNGMLCFAYDASEPIA